MGLRKLSLLRLYVSLSAVLTGCLVADRSAAIGAYAEAARSYDAGDMTATIAAAAESLKADASFLPALLLYGKASYLRDDDATAIEILERAVSLTPRSGEAALWLARAYRASGDGASARRSCELVLSCYPSDAAALRLASLLALDDDDVSLATAFLDRAIAAAGEVGLAFVDRAAIRWTAGDRVGALSDLDAALSTLPSGTASRAAAEALRASVRSARR